MEFSLTLMLMFLVSASSNLESYKKGAPPKMNAAVPTLHATNGREKECKSSVGNFPLSATSSSHDNVFTMELKEDACKGMYCIFQVDCPCLLEIQFPSCAPQKANHYTAT